MRDNKIVGFGLLLYSFIVLAYLGIGAVLVWAVIKLVTHFTG